jgi:tetratricopeptide (TPR) repeat protein
MSNWDPQQPYSYYPQPSRGPGKMILVLLVLGVLTVCLFVGAGLLMWRSTTAADDLTQSLVEGPAPLGRFNSLDEKHAAAAAAFNSESVGVNRRQMASIKHLFDAIVAATSDSDDARFARLVDAEILFLEMKSCGVMVPLGTWEERFALTWVEQSLGVPGPWNRYRITHVRPHASGMGALVYGYFWDEGGREQRVCWWIVRRGKAWKTYDWELLDYGIRDSKQKALCYTHGEDALLQRYLDCQMELAAADQLMEQGEWEQAAEKIRHTEGLRVLPALRDDAWLQIGNAWTRCGRMSEAMACFRRIESPDALPGVTYGQILCHESWGRHEKALKLASRYEALLGRSPVVDRLQGESLLALGRMGEAVVELQESLDVEPEQIDLLQSLGLALPDDEKTTLVDCVTRTADPAATTMSLAEVFVIYGDAAALHALSRLLAKIAPDAATEDYLAGLAKEIDGDYAAAGEMFKQAFGKQDDADKRQQYVYRYLESMISAGRPAEGYLGAPDRSAAFEYLADCYTSGDYDFPREDFAKLLDEHRRKQPEDPWLNYYTGVLLAEQKKYDEAEKQYAAGVAKSRDEEIRAAFRYPRIWALHAAGKSMEAYRAFGPAIETFRQLAGYYRWLESLSSQQTAELKSLVEAHRAAEPDDPWLDFYAGVVAQNEQNYDKADRLLARGCVRAEEEWIRSTCYGRRLEVRIASGEILSALEEVPPPEETFAYLAEQLSVKRDWSQLDLLIETYRRLDPGSGELLRWEVEMCWREKDYQRVIGLLAPWTAETIYEFRDWEVSALRERLVRSYLRLGRAVEAVAAAEIMYEQGQSLPLILTSAAQGDVEKTTQLLTELSSSQYAVTSVYYDEDIGHILRGKEFLPLRRRWPPGLRFDMGGGSVVVLLKKARQPDAGQLRDLLAAMPGTSPTVAEVPADATADAAASFVAGTSGNVYCVTFGSDRYQPDDDAYQPDIEDPALKRAVADHRGWLAIDVSSLNDTEDETEFPAACRLVAGSLGDDCLAVYFGDEFGDEGRLLLVESSTGDALRALQSSEALSELGEEVWMFRDPGLDEQVQKAIERRRRRLKEFCRALAERAPQQELFVKIQLRLGPALEPHWVAVRRIVHGSHGSIRFIGEFVADSLLAPEFRQGEPVCVEPYEVVDWKYSGQSKEPAGNGS